MSFAIVAGVAVAAVAVGGAMAANAETQEGLDSAQGAVNVYNKAARDSYTDGNLSANSYLAPYSGAGAGVLAKWAVQDGNTGIPPRPDKAQFKRADGSLDVAAYRAADNRWLSYTGAMANQLGIAPPPTLPDTRNLSNKNRALANKQFKQQQAAWNAQVNGPGMTPQAPARGKQETADSYAKRMRTFVNKELIPWAKNAGASDEYINQLSAAAGNIKERGDINKEYQSALKEHNKQKPDRAQFADRASFQAALDQWKQGAPNMEAMANQYRAAVEEQAKNLGTVVTNLTTFGGTQQDAINKQRQEAVNQAQTPNNPYAKTVTDEETWKASGDPSYIGPVNTLEDLQKVPGYQFGLDQATQSIQQSAAARGNLASGGALKELSKFTADYASGQWANLWQMRNQAFNQAANRSMQGAGMQNQIDLAKVGLAANADTLQANNTFNTGLNVGNNYSHVGDLSAGIETSKGDANAAQATGIANGVISGITTGVGMYGSSGGGSPSSTSPSFAEWMKNRNANSSTRVG